MADLKGNGKDDKAGIQYFRIPAFACGNHTCARFLLSVFSKCRQRLSDCRQIAILFQLFYSGQGRQVIAFRVVGDGFEVLGIFPVGNANAADFS